MTVVDKSITATAVNPNSPITVLTLGALSVGAGGTNTSFLPLPDRPDIVDLTHFYRGWESVNGGWLVRRRDRVTDEEKEATISGNPSYTTLTEAWVDPTILNYT